MARISQICDILAKTEYFDISFSRVSKGVNPIRTYIDMAQSDSHESPSAPSPTSQAPIEPSEQDQPAAIPDGVLEYISGTFFLGEVDVRLDNKYYEGGAGIGPTWILTNHVPYDIEYILWLPDNPSDVYGMERLIALIKLLKRDSLPIPQILGFDFTKDNAICKEFLLLRGPEGERLDRIFSNLRTNEKVRVVTLIAKIISQIETKTFSQVGLLSGNHAESRYDMYRQRLLNHMVNPTVDPLLLEGTNIDTGVTRNSKFLYELIIARLQGFGKRYDSLETLRKWTMILHSYTALSEEEETFDRKVEVPSLR